ncbi:MAG TPA: VapC toxin family PIN domain ribonuclease [Synechococcales bacterium UBA10510]|jgi:predicted nucleic-acid-binding protein|nr:VapC toxin family PIN domain ribonuclease [Synechococcales bacterium UBA10510]
MSLPVALDTNVLVRLLVNDDPLQAQQAAALIDASSACFVPITVALELEWVLRGAYKLPRDAVIAAFDGLLAICHLHLEQEDLVRRALDWHRQGLDFADALHLARSEGCGALISFDRQLAVLAGQLNLQPAVKCP